jgi:hypothetical protein
MSVRKIVRTLQENSKLSSETQVFAFDEALANLAEEEAITLSELVDLHLAFDDATEDHEVMFGLVHLIEDQPLETCLTEPPRV